MAPPATLTADELLKLHLPDKRSELVRGVLVVREPAGGRHGDVTMRLALELGNWVRSCDLGRIFAAGTGFTIARNPDTVRAPDVAFVRKGRLPHPVPRGYLELAPDLAVEVFSPDDRPGEVLAKVGDWLSAGAQLVWVVDPARREARVYRADGTGAVVPGEGVLDGESVLPGFTCPLGEVV
jgi:Uma2 family endonuclease